MIDLVFSFGSLSHTQSVSDEDGTRILNALRAFYLRGLPGGTQLTDDELFSLYVNNRVDSFKNLVKTEEGEIAAKTAKAAVPDVQVNVEGFAKDV